MRKLPLGHIVGYTTLTVILTAGAAQSLSGSNTVFTDDIADQNVNSVDIKDGQVRNSDLADGSITSVKIKDGRVTSDDLQDSGVRASDLGADAVSGAKVADDSLTGADLADNSVDGSKLADESVPRYKLDFSLCAVKISSGGGGSANCTGSLAASFSRQSAGVYCLDLPRGFLAGAVNIDGATPGFPLAYVQENVAHGCPLTTDVTVTTYNDASPRALADMDWYGLFY